MINVQLTFFYPLLLCASLCALYVQHSLCQSPTRQLLHRTNRKEFEFEPKYWVE